MCGGGSIKESLDRFGAVMEAAKQRNVRVRGYVSCVLGETHTSSTIVFLSQRAGPQARAD